MAPLFGCCSPFFILFLKIVNSHFFFNLSRAIHSSTHAFFPPHPLPHSTHLPPPRSRTTAQPPASLSRARAHRARPFRRLLRCRARSAARPTLIARAAADFSRSPADARYCAARDGDALRSESGARSQVCVWVWVCFCFVENPGNYVKKQKTIPLFFECVETQMLTSFEHSLLKLEPEIFGGQSFQQWFIEPCRLDTEGISRRKMG